jgi:hypothetical protein
LVCIKCVLKCFTRLVIDATPTFLVTYGDGDKRVRLSLNDDDVDAAIRDENGGAASDGVANTNHDDEDGSVMEVDGKGSDEDGEGSDKEEEDSKAGVSVTSRPEQIYTAGVKGKDDDLTEVSDDEAGDGEDEDDEVVDSEHRRSKRIAGRSTETQKRQKVGPSSRNLCDPKLPLIYKLHTAYPGPKKQERKMADLSYTPPAPETLRVKLFYADDRLPPLHFDFKAASDVVS